MTETPETITRDELAEALRGLKITPEDENTFYPAVADAIFEKAKRNREPEYEPGAVYQDADGGVWVYQPQGHDGGLCCWLSPGTQGVWSSVSPRRPLRKLVPEGSQASGLSYAGVRREVFRGIENGETASMIADRIFKLLEADHEL